MTSLNAGDATALSDDIDYHAIASGKTYPLQREDEDDDIDYMAVARGDLVLNKPAPAEAEEPKQEGLLKNAGRGALERGAQIGGNLLQFLDNVSKAGEKALYDTTGVNPQLKFKSEFPYVEPELRANPEDTGRAFGGVVQKAGEALSDVDAGYEPRFTWEGFKGDPTPANLAGFIVEQGVQSVPDMAAALTQLPAYIASRTEEIAETRAANKDEADVTGSDLGEAMVPAVASSLLERIGAKGVTHLGAVTGAKGIAKEAGKAALKEGGTEAAQENIEYAGETVGTDVPYDLATGADRSLAGAVAGAGMGGAVRGVTATVQSRSAGGDNIEADSSAQPAPEVVDAPLEPDSAPEVAAADEAPPEPVQTARSPRTVVSATPEEQSAWQQQVISELSATRKAQQALYRDGMDAEAKALDDQLAGLLRATRTPPPANWIQSFRQQNPRTGDSLDQLAPQRQQGEPRPYGPGNPQVEATVGIDDGAVVGMGGPFSAEQLTSYSDEIGHDYLSEATQAQADASQRLKSLRAEHGSLWSDRSPEGKQRMAALNDEIDRTKREEAEARVRGHGLRQQSREIEEEHSQPVSAETMSDQELQDRLAYLTKQAKIAGWSKPLVAARDGIRREISARAQAAVKESLIAEQNATAEGPLNVQERVSETPAAMAAQLESEPEIGAQIQTATPAQTSEIGANAESESTDIDSAPGSASSIVESEQETFPTMHMAQRAAGERGQSETHQVVGKGSQYVIVPKAPETASESIDAAAHEAATSPHNDLPEPTAAQKEAGNYRKGHIKFHGLDISIENPKGSKRRGVDAQGKNWESEIHQHYGYIKRTEGADGDHVDVFVGDDADSKKVFIIDQQKKDGSFDEHKVMLGFSDKLKAIVGYKKNYQKGWKVGPVTSMTMDQFKSWLKNGDTMKPLQPAEPSSTPESTPTNEGTQALKDAPAKPRAKKQLLPDWAVKAGVFVGKKVRARRDVDYLKAGETYTITSVDTKSAYFRNDNGSGTFLMNYQVKSAFESDAFESIEESQPTVAASAKLPVSAPAKKSGAAQADGAAPASGEKIKDFGEVLHGARKHYAALYADQLRIARDADIRAVPLSQSWPEPDYQKLIENGSDVRTVSLIRAMRDEIPTKPQRSWRLDGWTKQVQLLRGFADDLIASAVDTESVLHEIEKSEILSGLKGRADLYSEFGHGTSLKGIDFTNHFYTLYGGEQNVHIWEISKKSKATAFNNWPSKLAHGKTKAEAIENFRKVYAKLTETSDKKEREVRFDIYSRSGVKAFFIGKKVGKVYIDLKEFPTAAEARAYLSENQSELESLLAKKKELPSERRETNAPRVGIDHREGGDVTPEQFSEAFGFRGVQFGNYVEGPRRQQDLNRAYDALMDLAGVLNVPAKALSLNGSLGLAFGARGKGGKRAFAAHYEPGTIVINLTKGAGAGSLAHEWWHAVDNYFSRARGDNTSYLSDKPYERGAGVRPEMVAAFKAVTEAIQSSQLAKRSRLLDDQRSKPYWSTMVEMTARSFETYVIAKLQDQGVSNDYLANIVSPDYWDAAASLGLERGGSYPYPNAAELPAIRAAYDSFFTSVEARETEKGVALYKRSASTRASYERRIDELFAGAKPENQAGVRVLDKSDVMDLLGYGDHEVVLAEKHAVSDGRFNHPQFTAEDWKNVPDWLDNPVAVFERDDGNLMVIAPDTKNGNPIIIGVLPEKRQRGYAGTKRLHVLLTAYDKDNGRVPIERMMREGQLLFVDQRKSPAFNGSSGHRLPSNIVDLRGLKGKIYTGKDLFKYRSSPDYRLAPAGQASGASRSQVKDWIAPVLLKWHGGPNVEVVESFDALPNEIKRDHLERFGDQAVEGTRAEDGTVYLVADRLTSEEHALRTLAHEAIGHWSVEDILGEKLPDLLRKVDALSRVDSRVRAIAATVDQNYEGLDDDQRAREIIAHLAESGTKEITLDLWLGRLRNFLRKIGFTLQFSAADLRGILAAAVRRLETGKGGGYYERQAKPRKMAYRRADVASGDAEPKSTLEKLVNKQSASQQERVLKAARNIGGRLTPAALKTLTLRQLADVSSKVLPEVGQYHGVVQEMSAMRNRMAEQVADNVNDWMKWAKKNRTAADQLTNTMFEATLAGVDPDGEFVPLDMAKAQNRMDVLAEQARGRSGESTKRFIDEIKQIKEAIKAEPHRRADYARLKPKFDALSETQKKFYRRARDDYEARFAEMQKILEERITASIKDKRMLRATLDSMRYRFESAKVNAPYFPLQRFGRYWLETTTEPGGAGERAFMMFDDAGEQLALKNRLERQGFRTTHGTQIEKSRLVEGATGGFINEVMGIIDEQVINDEKRDALKDDVYQLFLQTLPSRSMRKQFIHRKKVEGFSKDAIRSYASSMIRGAYQLSRLKYSNQLQDLVADAQGNARTKNDNLATDYANELAKRHEWVMNPKNSAWANKVTSLGFVWMLGLSPAAGFVNLTQTFIVALPVLSSKFGWKESAAALATTSREFLVSAQKLSWKGLSIEAQLKGDDLKAYHALHSAGIIDKTQSHNLMGIAETDTTEYTDHMHRAMNFVGAVFHKAEVFNREVTAIAAYRLARKSGMDHDAAVNYAGQATLDGHFDYSNTNRAPFMQNDFAKVFLQFKQYSQNMQYFLLRNLWQMTKGQDPETRRMARTQLVGMLGMTSLFGGALALPTGMLFTLINAVADIAGDDDEPFDAETVFVKWLEDLLGTDAARWALRGVGSNLLNADLTSRISLKELWVRSPDRELEGENLWAHYAEQAAGPVLGGVVLNWLRAAGTAAEGNYLQAFEKALPKAFRDAVRAYRFNSEGARNHNDESIIEEFEPHELMLQLTGMSPLRLAEQYDSNSRKKQYEQSVLNRAARLRARYAMAYFDKDMKAMAQTLDLVRAFNAKYPELPITGSGLRQTIRNKARMRAESQNGVQINKRLKARVEKEAG